MFDQPKFRPNLFKRLGNWWCRMMHDSPMWPIRGHYQCRACGRRFLVPWVSPSEEAPVQIWIRPEPHAMRRAA